MKTRSLIITGIGLTMLVSCTHDNGWGISGNIAGTSEGTKVALEANNAGHWYLIDSIALKPNGDFSYKATTPYAGQDILRLTLPGKGSVYFPIDSIDKVTLSADAAAFGTGHKLSGSAAAQAIAAIDSMTATISDPGQLSQKLIQAITSDTTGIVAYYALGKSLGGKAIFNPNESLGNRAYGAVAQLYDTHRPNDPRAKAIRRAYFDGRRALGKYIPEMPQTEIDLQETGYFDIERYDARGNKQTLSQLADGKTVILNFTTYEHQGSPALNALLNETYTRFHDKGLEIYQIAFDSNEVTWKEAARNLPWTAVWNAPSDGSKILMNYNISELPTTFIINRQGVLIERVENISDLNKIVEKYI